VYNKWVEFQESLMAQSDAWHTFSGPERTWVIGAVHGEAKRLRQIHEAVSQEYRPGDRIVYSGNLMGYGSDVVGAINEALVFRRAVLARHDIDPSTIVFLRGSQEEMWRKLLQLHFAQEPEEVLGWMLSRGMKASLESYGLDASEVQAAAAEGRAALSRWTGQASDIVDSHDGHRAYMTNLRHAAKADDGSLLVVNSGFEPNVEMRKQLDSFWWGGAEFNTLQPEHSGAKLVVRGSTHGTPGVRVDRYTVTLDGGAGRGGKVCAALFSLQGSMVQNFEF